MPEPLVRGTAVPLPASPLPSREATRRGHQGGGVEDAPPMKHHTAIPPLSLGFAMPAEWEPHAATWMCWPFDDQEWKGHLEGARREFQALVEAIAAVEPVRLLCHDEEVERDARARLGSVDIHFHRVPLDDVWFRDNGPIFVTRAGPGESGERQVSLVNWRFNAWGGKYDFDLDDQAAEAVAGFLEVDHFDMPLVMEGGSLEVNGAGVGLTTRSCLMTPTRNPDLGEDDFERLLHQSLGIKRLLWLEGGLDGDHTDGHIDTIARFVDARTIVCATCDDPSDPNCAAMRRNLEALRAFTDSDGRPFDVVEVPLPRDRKEDAGARLALTYVNFYVANGLVVVPQYDDAHDARALEILRPLFPGREVVGLAASEIITSGGAFHCLTQQQPAGSLWRQS